MALKPTPLAGPSSTGQAEGAAPPAPAAPLGPQDMPLRDRVDHYKAQLRNRERLRAKTGWAAYSNLQAASEAARARIAESRRKVANSPGFLSALRDAPANILREIEGTLGLGVAPGGLDAQYRAPYEMQAVYSPRGEAYDPNAAPQPVDLGDGEGMRYPKMYGDELYLVPERFLLKSDSVYDRMVGLGNFFNIADAAPGTIPAVTAARLADKRKISNRILRMIAAHGDPDNLPMDEASRMARAREMGFGIAAYKGEAGELIGEGYRLGHPGQKDAGFLGEGIYATNSPQLAGEYALLKANRDAGKSGPNVMPLRLKMQNPYEIDMWQKQKLRFMSEDARAAWLKDKLDQDYDSIVVRYPHREAPGEAVVEEYMVPDPAQVRSRFAKFDPDKAGSPDLLATTGGASPAAKAGAREDEDD